MGGKTQFIIFLFLYLIQPYTHQPQTCICLTGMSGSFGGMDGVGMGGFGGREMTPMGRMGGKSRSVSLFLITTFYHGSGSLSLSLSDY